MALTHDNWKDFDQSMKRTARDRSQWANRYSTDDCVDAISYAVESMLDNILNDTIDIDYEEVDEKHLPSNLPTCKPENPTT